MTPPKQNRAHTLTVDIIVWCGGCFPVKAKPCDSIWHTRVTLDEFMLPLCRTRERVCNIRADGCARSTSSNKTLIRRMLMLENIYL